MSLTIDPGVEAPVPRRATYRQLIRTRGCGPLLGSALLTRSANQMWTVATVLFTLGRYHSPTITGLSIFLLIFPGLVVSPINGALLDKYGRRRLMTLDFMVAAACIATIVVLAAASLLAVWTLLLVLALGSLTSTLSIGGARSLFPLIIPRDLWDRANAADSLCYGLSQVVGPAIAGWVTAVAGSEAALAVAGAGFVVAAVAIQQVPDPATRRETSGAVLRDAWLGVRYVVANRSLRWLAVTMWLTNIGWGVVIVALPLLVFRLHGNAAAVGGLLALQGIVGIPSTLLAGRLRTEGRERAIMRTSAALIGAATFALLIPSFAGLALAVAMVGFADGPLNVALFSLRQRRTNPAWFGRAFAVSISLNFAGVPLGSAASGPLLSASMTVAIIGAAVLPMVASVLMSLIPSRDERPATVR